MENNNNRVQPLTVQVNDTTPEKREALCAAALKGDGIGLGATLPLLVFCLLLHGSHLLLLVLLL